MSSREEEKNQRREARTAAEEAARSKAVLSNDVFPDTGPQPDGTRTNEQWQNAISEDMALVMRYLIEARDPEDEQAKYLALAQKEAMRLHSDIRRYGEEVLGITKKDLDNVGPL